MKTNVMVKNRCTENWFLATQEREEQNTPLLWFGITLIELSPSSSNVSNGSAEGTTSRLLYVRPHCNHVSHYAFLWEERERERECEIKCGQETRTAVISWKWIAADVLGLGGI